MKRRNQRQGSFSAASEHRRRSAAIPEFRSANGLQGCSRMSAFAPPRHSTRAEITPDLAEGTATQAVQGPCTSGMVENIGELGSTPSSGWALLARASRNETKESHSSRHDEYTRPARGSGRLHDDRTSARVSSRRRESCTPAVPW